MFVISDHGCIHTFTGCRSSPTVIRITNDMHYTPDAVSTCAEQVKQAEVQWLYDNEIPIVRMKKGTGGIQDISSKLVIRLCPQSPYGM
jgi:hypothetical protein